MRKNVAMAGAAAIGLLAITGFMFQNSSSSQASSPERRVVAQLGNAEDQTQFKDFELWRLECADALNNCQIFQRLTFTKNSQDPKAPKSLALQFIIYKKSSEEGKNQTRVRFITPLGLDLTAGLGLRVDEGNEYQMPFQSCSSKGCVSDFQLGDDVLKSLRSGQTAFVGYRLQNAKPVVLRSSLEGMSEAYRALEATSS